MKLTTEQQAILRAFADGKTVQARFAAHVEKESQWTDCESFSSLSYLECDSHEYRVKPNTIKVVVNGKELEFPEPVRDFKQIPLGTVDVYVVYGLKVTGYMTTHGAMSDLLASGLVHLTRHAAQQHLDVLIQISKGGVL